MAVVDEGKKKKLLGTKEREHKFICIKHLESFVVICAAKKKVHLCPCTRQKQRLFKKKFKDEKNAKEIIVVVVEGSLK